MAKLKRAATVAILAIGLVLIAQLGRGMITGNWIGWRGIAFIAVALGVVAALLDRFLADGGSKPAPQPAIEPAAFGRRRTVVAATSAPVRLEPRQSAIVFRQQMPPVHDPGHLSFFGGLPVAGPGLQWPVSPKGDSLHFLLQVDCAAIPQTLGRDVLPARGVLYFFLDLRWGKGNSFRVLHADAGSAVRPVPAPADLAAAYGSEARHAWRWTAATDALAARSPILLPKWPFDPVLIPVPSALVEAWRDETIGENEDAVFWWPEGDAMHAVLLEAQGAETPVPRVADAAPGYPQDWRAVEIGAALLLRYVERALRYPKSDPRLRDMTAEELAMLGERIAAEAGEWLALAAARASFDATTGETRAAFLSWLESWDDFSKMVIGEAETLSTEASLGQSAEAAARIPAGAVARVADRHVLALRRDGRIFAPTPDRMLAPPSYVQGNQEEIAQEKLLLLELSSNEGIGHHFGEGVYQFWISPADLRASRFDRVVLTTDAY